MQAFCRTTTCDAGRGLCARLSNGCVVDGAPLHWTKPSVSVELDGPSAAAAGFDVAVVRLILRSALDTWENASCTSGKTPALHFTRPTHGSPRAPDIVLRFEPQPERDEDPTVLASSDVEFDRDGVLTHVMIRMLAGPRRFAIDDVAGKYDLASSLVHELGHAVGLSHTDAIDAVMFGDARRGELARTLAPDDHAAICAAYPPTALVL